MILKFLKDTLLNITFMGKRPFPYRDKLKTPNVGILFFKYLVGKVDLIYRSGLNSVKLPANIT